MVDASRKSEKTAPSKLTHRKYFPYSCILYTCFCAVLKHFRELNSRLGIHSLSANNTRFSTSQRHWRLTSPFCVDTRMCAETTSFSSFSRQYTSMHVVLPVFQTYTCGNHSRLYFEKCALTTWCTLKCTISWFWDRAKGHIVGFGADPKGTLEPPFGKA